MIHMSSQRFILLCAGLLLSSWPCVSRADGIMIDKIYHPYVQPQEQELEGRAIFQDEQEGMADDVRLYRLAYGRALNDRWFLEAYIVGGSSAEQNFEVEAYELEAKWQLTEQGEFWADWGLLFELEKEAHEDIWEFSTALLVEKEWGRWSATANLFVIAEWGTDIENELETNLNLQARYRYSRLFEPAVEFYSGQDTVALGPVVMGQFSMGPGRRFHWEAGLLFGLDSASPDHTVRLLAEFEF
jgi:hypothetical protein